MREFVNATEAAFLINRNDRVVRRLIKDGLLAATPTISRRAVKDGSGPSAWRISLVDLLACAYVQVIPERLRSLDPDRPAAAVAGHHRSAPDDSALHSEIARLRDQLDRRRAPEATVRIINEPAPPAISIHLDAQERHLPEGSLPLRVFVEMHQARMPTIYDQIRHQKISVTAFTTNRKDGQREYWIVPAQMSEIIGYWMRQGTPHTPCSTCPHAL